MRDKAAQHLPETLRGDIMTIAQQWEAEGFQKGFQEGFQKGIQQALQRHLQQRFGSLPLTYVQRIVDADPETLLHWGRKMLNANTLQDVFDEN